MPVSSNFSMDSYNSRDRGRRSSESSSASDATRERRASTGVIKKKVSVESTENIPTRRTSVGPKPAANPMRFVAAGPTPLLRTASEQMLKAEKLKMATKSAVKEEESAAWQNNLDNWKSSRRKRQEDVIERLTEVKKMEEEDHDRGRRRGKTFGEMMQDRSTKGRRMLQVYTDDDNDISSLLSAKSPTSSDTKSDLGFATSSDTGSEPSDHQDSPAAEDVIVQKPVAPSFASAPISAPTPYRSPGSSAAVRSPPAPAPAPTAPAAPAVWSPPAPAPAPEPEQAEPEPEPEPASEPESAGWEDPTATVDEMEARILRQLEESERTQMSAPEPPVVLDFTLQPSAAPPPSEKPPPPPPVSDDESPLETPPAKSTNKVKKDLYRRRSDFLGIQGRQDEEPTPAVARPPDMESLLRQERAQQQEQERRRQAERARQESLRRAEEEAEARAEEFRRRAQQEQEQRAVERRAAEERIQREQAEEQERRQQERAAEQERRQQEQAMEQERRAQEQQQERRQQELQEQQRREQELQRRQQEAQEQEWRRRSAPPADQGQAQERWAQESMSDQEREWRRRKELLSEEDVDRQEREIMESLEQEESWRHQQKARYQSRLARLQQAENTWQHTQEAPPGSGSGSRAPSDLLASRQQARSNPNLLQELPAAPPGGPAPLQQSRSHGRLYEPDRPQRHLPPHASTPPPPSGPAKPQRAPEQVDNRSARPAAVRSQTLPADTSPGQMTRHTLQALAAAPRSNLRHEWVPRKRADAPRNTGQHWLIQEAEQRRISEQQERTSRQQQQQQQLPQQSSPQPYQSARAPPPLQQQQYRPAQHPQQAHHFNNYYTQQPIYENTPAQLNAVNAANNNNYQEINTVRPNYGTQVYHSPETRAAVPEQSAPPPASQSSPEDRVLSVSGRKKCSHCGDELGRGAAMIIESLRLFYHINCFKCCVCNLQLGNGSMGADVRVRNNKLHCHDCYSNDEGLKFSKV